MEISGTESLAALAGGLRPDRDLPPARNPCRGVRHHPGAPGDRAGRRVPAVLSDKRGRHQRHLRQSVRHPVCRSDHRAAGQSRIYGGSANRDDIQLDAGDTPERRWLAIPIRTLGHRYRDFLDVKRHPETRAPDRSKPFSHLVTGMMLRAFAADPSWHDAPEVGRAGELLASRLFQTRSVRRPRRSSYWERVSFPFWFADIVSALDTLSRLGVSRRSDPIAIALRAGGELQHDDGTLALKLLRTKDKDLRWWICLAVCRSLRRWWPR